MNNFLGKIITVSLIILFFSLPLVNSHLLNIFGIDFGYYVDGNYEFTKVIFFNILSGIIFILFGINKLVSNKNINLLLSINLLIIGAIFFSIIGISTFLSLSPYLSLFGSPSKGHGMLMFVNLLILLIILINQNKKTIKIILKSLIIGVFITALLSIKEYFLPSLDYGDLSNRALGTMGHPNYLALVILLIFPLLYNKLNNSHKIFKYKKYLYYLLLFTLIIALFLTKSLFGIILFIFYTYYFIVYKVKNKFNKKIFNYVFLSLILIFILLSFYFYPEKISSFLSRFYIWKTTLSISFDNIKILIFGGGFDTLDLIFNKYKDMHLYIFENIGFTADRPHNFIINIFYHLGLFGLTFFFYILYILKKNYFKFKNEKYKKIYLFEIIFLFLIFTLFNFPSIVSYAILILIIAYIFETGLKNIRPVSKITFPKILFLIIIILYSIISISYFTTYYTSEIYAYNNNYNKAIKIFKYNADNYYKIGENEKGLQIGKYKSEYYYFSKLYYEKNNILNCNNLTKSFQIAENYFLCGDLFYNLGNKEIGINYYKKGLEVLPNLWNNNSKYYNNIFTKNIISTRRFFSEKYSDIKNILKIVNNQR